jgi:hypothetical protein
VSGSPRTQPFIHSSTLSHSLPPLAVIPLQRPANPSPPGTVPRATSSSQPDKASTASPSTSPSASSSSPTPTSRSPPAERSTRSTRETRSTSTRPRSSTPSLSSTPVTGSRTRRGTLVRWWRMFIGHCCTAASSGTRTTRRARMVSGVF